MDVPILDLKYRIDRLEADIAQLKQLAEQTVDLRDRIDALTKILLQKDVVTVEETAAMLLSRRTRRRQEDCDNLIETMAEPIGRLKPTDEDGRQSCGHSGLQCC